MKAAIYVRVRLHPAGGPERALQSQGDASRTRAAHRQEEACRVLAEERGWEVVSVYVDGNHSVNDVRPSLERLIDDVQSGRVEAVVTWSADRLARSPAGFPDDYPWTTFFGAELATVA